MHHASTHCVFLESSLLLGSLQEWEALSRCCLNVWMYVLLCGDALQGSGTMLHEWSPFVGVHFMLLPSSICAISSWCGSMAATTS